MELDQRTVVVYDVENLMCEFYGLLEQMGCFAGVSIPEAVLTTAVMNQVLGYSPFRGTAQTRVKTELEVFGIPPLVAEDLFSKLCAKVKAQLVHIAQREIFQTDFFYKFVDSTTIVLVER